jgi:hypothetical protein
MPLILPSNSISGGYEVANSVRLNDGSSDGFSLSGQNGNRKTFTFSCWVKRGVFGENFLFNSRIDASNHFLIRFTGGHQLELLNRTSASNNFILTTNRLFRDVSAWYHIVVAVDTTQSTANDRVKFYVNGVQETSFATQTMGSQNADLSLNTSTTTHYIGQEHTSGSNFFDGYMSEVILVDGQALDPTSFGEFDEDSGIWKPIDVSGLTFGTNGFYLDFENSGSLGADVSGNGNNFTVNNLTSIDQTTDTPTNNFCTFNPLVNVPYTTFSQGNTFVDLTSTGGSSHHTNYGNIAFSSGKWYWEAKALGGNKYTIGLSDANNQSNYQQVAGTNLIVGNHANSYISGDAIGWYSTTLYKNGSIIASSLSDIVTNDIMMVAVDCDNGKIYFGKNGTWRVANSTTFDSTQNDTTFTTGEFYVSAFSNEDCDWSVNWGNPAYSISSGNSDANGYGNFEYAVPSGYYALNTKNLSEFG